MLRLAWRNVSRDWNRSVLAISGMALAAFVLTSALALSNTYHAGALARYRFALGGDIVALPGHFFVDRALYGGASGGEGGGARGSVAGGAPAGAADWTLRRWDPTWQGNLGQFVPGIGEKGYLAPANDPDVFRLDTLQASAGAFGKAGVAGIYPYLSLPAFTETAGKTYPTPLRARQAGFDAVWVRQDEVGVNANAVTPGIRLVTGRWLEPSDEGRMVALVSANRPAGAGPAPAPDTTVTVSVPAVTVGADGRPVFDYGRRQEFRLQIVGLYNVTLDVVRENEGEGGTGSAPVPWETGDIMIPSKTFETLYSLVSGGAAPEIAGQLGLVVKDMNQMNRTLKALSQAFPDWTFLPAPQLAGMMQRQAGGAIPANLSGTFVLVSFLLAGALAAGNMYVVIYQRSKQIGILRSIGASSRQVFGMVLVEVVGYSLAGGLVGWVLVLALYSLIVLTSGAGLAAVGAKAGSTLVVVMGTTLAVAAAFGLAPAWFAAGQPAARVLRHD